MSEVTIYRNPKCSKSRTVLGRRPQNVERLLS
jgi:arsenate reductase-like glutaredoxin family protein